MLSELQQHLTDIYKVDAGHDVRDYLITDRAVAIALGQGALIQNTDESLLVAHDDDGLALSIYLDEAMLKRLNSADPLTRLRAEQLDDLWKVIEGISHFNYLVWSAARDRSVTLLELEMQAEVDKFVSTLLLVLEQGDLEMMTRLHGWLFESIRFKPELEPEQRERYRAANEYASRYCHRLRAQLVAGDSSALRELRRFYRLSQTDKISHIHASAWAKV